MKKLLILCMTFLCILTGCGNVDSAQNAERKRTQSLNTYKNISADNHVVVSRFVCLAWTKHTCNKVMKNSKILVKK